MLGQEVGLLLPFGAGQGPLEVRLVDAQQLGSDRSRRDESQSLDVRIIVLPPLLNARSQAAS